MGGYALRAPKDSVRPRRLVGASGRPLNFTVRSHWVKTAAIFGAVVLVLLANAVASVRIARSEVLSRTQKSAWLLVVWLAPLIGAILALQVSREASVPAPVPGSLEEGPSAGIVMQTGGHVGGPSSDGGSSGGPFVSQ